MDKSDIVEIRWHGRGGQGAVTSAELLAKAAISEGKFAQAFPAFGPERRGAPVVAYNRISQTKAIRVRAGITEPHVVVVLDATVLRVVNVADGLRSGGTVIVNSSKPASELRGEFKGNLRLAAIDATKIARETLGVPIVNTTMLGALIKASGVVKPDSLVEPLQERFGRLAERNINAMKRAFEETTVEELR
jgi:pyruvate ferredoxin oxidoreductase gamma subunit